MEGYKVIMKTFKNIFLAAIVIGLISTTKITAMEEHNETETPARQNLPAVVTLDGKNVAIPYLVALGMYNAASSHAEEPYNSVNANESETIDLLKAIAPFLKTAEDLNEDFKQIGCWNLIDMVLEVEIRGKVRKNKLLNLLLDSEKIIRTHLKNDTQNQITEIRLQHEMQKIAVYLNTIAHFTRTFHIRPHVMDMSPNRRLLLMYVLDAIEDFLLNLKHRFQRLRRQLNIRQHETQQDEHKHTAQHGNHPEMHPDYIRTERREKEAARQRKDNFKHIQAARISPRISPLEELLAKATIA